MITTALIYLGLAIISPLRNLPNVTLSSDLTNAVISIGSTIKGINGLFPVDTLFAILGAFLVMEIAIGLYKIISWIIKKIPTIS